MFSQEFLETGGRKDMYVLTARLFIGVTVKFCDNLNMRDSGACVATTILRKVLES